MKLKNIDIENLILYQFVYNPCIWESAPKTISIHLTKEGAEKAKKEHKIL
jgi:hypothetical protein